MSEVININGLYRCPRFEACVFFQENGNQMPELMDRLRKRFCCRDNTRCARLWVVNELGVESVPDTMMPHQYEWAQQILCDAGKSAALYEDAFSDAVARSSAY